jgi:hypothetical protein
MSSIMQEGEDFYYNEEGLFVFTAAWHLKKGFCCGNGCLHCPYDYTEVPEERRKVLLDASNNKDNSAS